MRRTITGVERTVRDLDRELAKAGEGREAATAIPVLPRHKITIGVLG